MSKWNNTKPITKEQFDTVFEMITALQKKCEAMPPWTFEDLQKAKDAAIARRDAGLPTRTAFDIIKDK